MIDSETKVSNSQYLVMQSNKKLIYKWL